MSDNLFEQLFELFNQPGPVNWRLAEEVAGSLSGDAEPVDPWLADEYTELGNLALLQAATVDLLPDLAAAQIDPVAVSSATNGWMGPIGVSIGSGAIKRSSPSRVACLAPLASMSR